MTKTEKQILIDKLEEYAVARGYYQAAINADISQGKDTKLVKNMRSVSHDASLIVSIMENLGIKNAAALKAEFVRKGYEQFLENNTRVAECQG
jgi:hypothetical protein